MMKSFFLMILTLACLSPLMAATKEITLKRDMTVLVNKEGSSLQQYVTLNRGARVEIDCFETFFNNRAYFRLFKVRRVKGNRGSHEFNRAVQINRDTNRNAWAQYYISESSLNADVWIDDGYRRDDRRYMDHPDFDRGRDDRHWEHTDYRRTTDIVYDRNSYEMCYEKPRSRYKVINRKQNRRGKALALVGGILTVGGLIHGGDAGNIAAGAGIALGTLGLIDITQSVDKVFDVELDCRRYYRTEVRPVVIEHTQCTTTRYYTTGWGHNTEYFETRCGTSRYMSFERNHQIWY